MYKKLQRFTKTVSMKPFALAFFLTATIIFSGCSVSDRGYATRHEKLSMKMRESANRISLERLKDQGANNIASRGAPITDIAGGLLSLATDAVKKMIADDQLKYTATYKFGTNDIYFYDQLSNEEALDPVGMQLGGFSLDRQFENMYGKVESAFSAEFEVDTTDLYAVINNSTFKLRVKNLQLKYAKAKVPNRSKKLNVDIEIDFTTSYVNELGMIFDNVTLGKFYLLLRDAPLDPTDPNYEAYYKNLEGQPLIGKSFIVPRSFGYRKENGVPVKTYSRGLYNINVMVKECSKESFVSKFLYTTAPVLLDANRDWTKKQLPKSLPKTMQ